MPTTQKNDTAASDGSKADINLLVVTDLDGTLLDHDTYSHHAAESAIKRLQSLHIPIVFNTSKTHCEVEVLQEKMCISDPFIVENGAALYIPKTLCFSQQIHRSLPNSSSYLECDDYDIVMFGEKRSVIVNALNGLKSQFQFESLSDWTVERMIQETGLTEASARKSMQREYSEPFIWQDSEARLTMFISELAKHDISVTKGGRFYHAIGQTEKAKPLKYLQTLYGACLPVNNNDGEASAYRLVCLGDSRNDVEMLNEADFPVLVRSPTQGFPALKEGKKGIIKTMGLGPIGWSQAINDILDSQI